MECARGIGRSEPWERVSLGPGRALSHRKPWGKGWEKVEWKEAVMWFDATPGARCSQPLWSLSEEARATQAQATTTTRTRSLPRFESLSMALRLSLPVSRVVDKHSEHRLDDVAKRPSSCRKCI